MVAQINFSVQEKTVSVAPGASVDLDVTVENLTTLLDQVAVRAEGIEPAWVQVVPPQLPVFAQSRAIARVIVQPPLEIAQALAGNYPLRVTGSSQENPDQVGEASAELEIQHIGDYQAQLEPGRSTREPGIFDIFVKNRANAPLEITLRANDELDALWYKFEPFQLIIAPGAEAPTRLQVRPKQIRANLRQVEFTMLIDGEYILKGGTRIRATAQTLSATSQVPAPEALRLHIQPVLNGHASAKSFEVQVSNPATLPVTVHLSGQVSNSSLEFDFTPEELTVSPRSQATAMLAVRAVSALPDGATEDFRVLALPEDDGLEPVSVEGTFVASSLPAPARAFHEPAPVQPLLPKRASFPWAPLLSGTLSLVVTFLIVLGVALVSGWSP